MNRLVDKINNKIGSRIAIVCITILSLFLNLISLKKIGYGNQYYAAAVKSMALSWKNFFFGSFDPGGFVTVDKPPVAYWFDVISTKIFGFNSFGLLLPHVLVATLSVVLVYFLVKKTFGNIAGLISALVLALSPVLIIVARNNTPDSILIFFLILAVWALFKSINEKSLKYLLISAAVVGIGFNIKMLQAYLVVPAFIITYFVSAYMNFKKKFAHLFGALVVLIVVSFSWMTIVELTPKANRPYIGSSQDNSAFSLALGYNGLERLLGQNKSGGMRNNVELSTANLPQNIQGRQGGGMFMQDGKSAFRLVKSNLGSQAGWLIPFALVTILPFFFRKKLRLPINNEQRDVVLWGMWLITGIGFFSIAGFFHEYYLSMLTPAIAALVGIGVVKMYRIMDENSWKRFMPVFAILLTVVGQYSILRGFPTYSKWLSPVIIGTLIIFLITFIYSIFKSNSLVRFARNSGYVLACLGLFVSPVVWSIYTASQAPNATIPTAGPSSQGGRFGPGGNMQELDGRNGNQQINMDGMPQDGSARRRDGRNTSPQNNFNINNVIPPQMQNNLGGNSGGGLFEGREVNEELLNYLEQNQRDTKFLLGTTNSMTAAPYIIKTGKPVMNIGGFNGNDPILKLGEFQEYIKNNRVRFFIVGGFGGGMGRAGGNFMMQYGQTTNTSTNNNLPNAIPGLGWGTNGEIIQWVYSNCKIVDASKIYSNNSSSQDSLYDCKI